MISWTKTLTARVRDIALNPGNPNVLYSTVTSSSDGTFTPGVYRSSDGGRTWGSAPIYASPYAAHTEDVRVAISAASPQTIWVYAGDDSDPSHVSVAAIDDTGKGTRWNLDTNTFDSGQFGYNTYIAADPVDATTVYIGSRDAWKLRRNADGSLTRIDLSHSWMFKDNAWTFVPASGLMHTDQHRIAFSPDKRR